MPLIGMRIWLRIRGGIRIRMSKPFLKMMEGSRIKPFKSEGCDNKYIAFDMNLKPRILDKQDDKYLYPFDW